MRSWDLSYFSFFFFFFEVFWLEQLVDCAVVVSLYAALGGTSSRISSLGLASRSSFDFALERASPLSGGFSWKLPLEHFPLKILAASLIIPLGLTIVMATRSTITLPNQLPSFIASRLVYATLERKVMATNF